MGSFSKALLCAVSISSLVMFPHTTFAETVTDHLKRMLDDYRRPTSIHYQANESGTFYISDPGGSPFTTKYECWYTIPGYREVSQSTGNGMLSVDVRFDGRTVEIFNEKSGVLDIRHDVTRIKPGAPDNPLLLPFNAFIPSADKSKGATLSWTDLMSGGLVESAIAEVIPCQGRAGETDAGTIPKARLFAMECKYIIYFDDAHKLLTTIEAYSNKTAKQIELIKLTYADYLYKGATVYFPTYANVAINNEDGSPLVKEEWKVGKIDIDVPVNTDMFSMDYQGARYVDDLDTGQWIKSPNLSEADLAKAVAEVVHPPQLPTVAPGTANSEDSSFTYYTTASLLIVAAVGAAIYLRRRLLPTSK